VAIRALAPYFEHKLFLSATPHNGYKESFSALLELLDNQRFARAVPPNRAQLDAIMVRRMKSELELRWDGTRRFAERRVKHLDVPYSAAEKKAHQTLSRYAELRAKSAATAGEQFATEFVLKLLKKRLFSSPAAFATTLEKHARSVAEAGRGSLPGSLQRQLEEVDNDFANDEDYETTALEAVESASRHVAPLVEEEKSLLKELREFAVHAASSADTKARRLIQWLNDALKPGGQLSDRRVILFTEYRATQKWLHDLLAAEGLGGPDRLRTIYGGMALEDRERVKAAFQADPAESPVRILLATDAASEGINLQNHCSQLIHYEIPWNPNRMEQRNGRVDRHGQKHPEVHVYHFVGAGFNETKPGQAPGTLKAILEKLAQQLQDTERDLRLSPANIQNVVETGLALAGQPKLRPVGEHGAFHVPALTGSWALCAEGLAHPHSRKIRPIAFDHALAAGRDDVVLCHLNHRLVQMCLRLLRAEIWSQGQAKKLHRFTTRMVARSTAVTTPRATAPAGMATRPPT
jgi:hypothetical protein